LERVTYLHIPPHSLGQPAYFFISNRELRYSIVCPY